MHRSLIVEFIGTFFLCLVVALGRNEWAIGGAIASLTYAGFHISGAHFNPAITVAVFLRGKITFAEGLRYLMAQGAAAVAAVLVGLIWYVKGPDVEKTITMTIFFQSLVGEALGVFALAFVYLSVTTVKALEGNAFFGFAIGVTALAMSATFGALLNPTVAISQVLLQNAHAAVIFSCLIGSALGGFGAAFVVNMLQGEKISIPLDVKETPPTQL